MRIRTYILCCGLLALAFIPGCNKDNSGNTNLIRTYSYPYNPPSIGAVNYDPHPTITFSYDNMGRRTRTSMGDTYLYPPGKVIIPSSDTIFLNDKGLIARQTATADIYTYDTSGFLIQDSVPANGGAYASNTVYTIASGNTTKAVLHHWNHGTLTIDSTSYTFYPTVDLRDWGLTYMSKQFTNLIKTQTSSVDGSVANYTYTFDSRGRVNTQVLTYGGNSIAQTFNYTYY